MSALCVTIPGSALAGFSPSNSDIDPDIFRMDEKKYLGEKMSGKYTLVDEKGREFTLKDLRGKSRVLTLAYYTCEGSCPVFNANLAKMLTGASALGKVKSGADFTVLTLSFDKHDNAKTAAHFREMLDLPKGLSENWVFATFKNPDDIKDFTSNLGYRFFWSAQDQMFYHPNAYIFLSPEGRIVRVMHNSNIEPQDVELAILDTNFNKLQPSQIVALAVSLCYSYNYKDGKYGLNYPLFIAVGALCVGFCGMGYGVFVIKKRAKSKEKTVL